MQDELFDAVANGVHTAGIFHLIVSLEVLGDAFDFGVLSDHKVAGLLRIAVQVSEALLERSFHTHDVYNGRAFLLQVVAAAMPPNADAGDIFIFHNLLSSQIEYCEIGFAGLFEYYEIGFAGLFGSALNEARLPFDPFAEVCDLFRRGVERLFAAVEERFNVGVDSRVSRNVGNKVVIGSPAPRIGAARTSISVSSGRL